MSNQSNELALETLSTQEQFWGLTLLWRFGGHQGLLGRHSKHFDEDDLLLIKACGVCLSDKSVTAKATHVLPCIEEAYHAILTLPKRKLFAVHNVNILMISEWLNLSQIEAKLLNFVASFKYRSALDSLLSSINNATLEKTYYLLAVLLNEPKKAVKKALAKNGMLARSGFLRFDNRVDSMDPSYRFDTLSDHFVEMLNSEQVPLVELIKDRVQISERPKLKASDYHHLKSQYPLLKTYLRQAFEHNLSGVNVLLYGPPGTGKTELVRALAADCAADLYEVAGLDEEGDVLSAKGRMDSFSAAQAILSQSNNMILFDEIEDIFSRDHFKGSYAASHKYMFTRLLESNAVPTVWVSNDVSCIDRALIRRFDMVFKLAVPPQQTRKDIIRSRNAGVLNDSELDACASHEDISPAVIERVSNVITQTKDYFDKDQNAEHFKCLVNNVLSAQGHKELRKTLCAQALDFDPSLISCEVDIVSLPRSLARNNTGRLCLYGPPGTGKTAYGHWLAEQLDKPLMLKKVSDLMSMYLGQTEQNIAAAFEEARQSQAVLMIDEVDSFLQDRRQAQRSWEVTQINEMLTQMESFNGVFIASTNLVDGLDAASLRRFDLKMKFDYLSAEHSQVLFQRLCAALHLKPPGNSLKQKLAAIAMLTPGDFAVMQRRHQFAPFECASQVYEALLHDVEFKAPSSKPIGFVH